MASVPSAHVENEGKPRCPIFHVTRIRPLAIDEPTDRSLPARFRRPCQLVRVPSSLSTRSFSVVPATVSMIPHSHRLVLPPPPEHLESSTVTHTVLVASGARTGHSYGHRRRRLFLTVFRFVYSSGCSLFSRNCPSIIPYRLKMLLFVPIVTFSCLFNRYAVIGSSACGGVCSALFPYSVFVSRWVLASNYRVISNNFLPPFHFI